MLKITYKKIDDLVPYARNSRTHTPEQVAQIVGSIKEFGFTNPILIDEQGGIIAGHGRCMAANKLGLKEVPTIILSGLTEAQKKAYTIADNKLALNAGWNEEMLRVELLELQEMEFDLELTGFSMDELEDFDLTLDEVELDENKTEKGGIGSLSERFGIAPFSVLNAREGWWQNRKRMWISMGIDSGEGRDSGMQASLNVLMEKVMGKNKATESNDSIFDPVLAELCYRWWCPSGGTILDPFAGGSVRGIVASKLGRQYIGGELSVKQVDANRKQAQYIIKEDEIMPVWVNADSRIIDRTCSDVKADFIFSCPPYVNLEVYSDDPKDLSTLGYKDFKDAYFEIIKKTCSLLKDDRFACFVVGEVRDKKGNYYNFVGDTIDAFRKAGLEYYNEAILVTSSGSLALTAGRFFEASRKLGKTHQNVLVFLKGDAKKATKECGICEFLEDNGELSYI